METRNAKHETRNEGGRFPMGLCAASIVVTGAGLGLAAIDVQWGQERTADSLGLAWGYVNVATVMVWLLVWPILSANGRRAELAFEGAAIAVTAMPAFVVAASVSLCGGGMIVREVLLQAAIGIFAMGMMGQFWGNAPGVLACFAVALPVAGYGIEEFFSHGRSEWLWGVPAIAAMRAALAMMNPGYWWTVGFYLLVGAGLLVSKQSTAGGGR
jgi:hypothetical protein